MDSHLKTIDEKHAARCKYQNELHKEKKDFIVKLKMLLLPQKLVQQETRIVLKAIRQLFEEKFPERIGKDNGCLFRRTVEVNCVRTSVWATSDFSKNVDLFHTKLCQDKSFKTDINTFSPIPIRKTIKKEAPVESPLEHPKVGLNSMPIDNRQYGDWNMNLSTHNTVSWHVPVPPAPQPMLQATYPEQRTVFGPSYLQQMDYKHHAQELYNFSTDYLLTLPPPLGNSSNLATLQSQSNWSNNQLFVPPAHHMNPANTQQIQVKNEPLDYLDEMLFNHNQNIEANNLFVPPFDSSLLQPFEPPLTDFFSQPNFLFETMNSFSSL